MSISYIDKHYLVDIKDFTRSSGRKNRLKTHLQSPVGYRVIDLSLTKVSLLLDGNEYEFKPRRLGANCIHSPYSKFLLYEEAFIETKGIGTGDLLYIDPDRFHFFLSRYDEVKAKAHLRWRVSTI